MLNGYNFLSNIPTTVQAAIETRATTDIRSRVDNLLALLLSSPLFAKIDSHFELEQTLSTVIVPNTAIGQDSITQDSIFQLPSSSQRRNNPHDANGVGWFIDPPP